MVVEIEHFFGCYLLINKNPQFLGRTYIGFTVDPRRRISQHNKGSKYGGAKRTSGKGPWDMVLIVFGFPNKITALMFEWAWQHPKISRRLRHVTGKRKSESSFRYNLRVLSNMLIVGPWCRLPLTVQWIKQEHKSEFDGNPLPPIHIPIAFGAVTSIQIHAAKTKKNKRTTKNKAGENSTDEDRHSNNRTEKGVDKRTNEDDGNNSDDKDMVSMTQTVHKRCDGCMKRIQPSDSTLSCLYPTCSMVAHMICLARRFLRPTGSDHMLPVYGSCPVCKEEMLWGDLIRKKWGCYSKLSASEDDNSSDHWAEDLKV